MKSTITYLQHGRVNPLLLGLAVTAFAGCSEQPTVAETIAEGASAAAPSTATINQALAQVESSRSAAGWLQAPTGCTEIQAGEFLNGIELAPVQYSPSPTYKAAITGLGDPAVTDSLQIRLDAATSLGLYSLAGANSNLFTCEECVFGIADQQASHIFVADAGSVLVAAKINPQQTIGALTGVTLREAVISTPSSGPYKGTAIVPGGACYWIRFATWNTVRAYGCDPAQSSITSHIPGFTCVADNYSANDGTLERTAGAKQRDEQCTYTAATGNAPAISDCATGYTCSNLFDDARECLKTCDFMAADPGCDADQVCGVYGVCIEQSTLQGYGFDFDPAQIGEACTLQYSEFCGSEGARGVCLALGGAGTQTCYPYERARTDCAPGEELGYVSYPLDNGGFDRSSGFCYPL